MRCFFRGDKSYKALGRNSFSFGVLIYFMKKTVLALFMLLGASVSQAQVLSKYDVSLKPVTINGFTGTQSFVFGQYNGDWVLIGGRTDGLHLRQPNSSFSQADNNKLIYVINPLTAQLWTANLNTLSAALDEQLQSTNMQFYQRGNTLYVLGGYGFSNTSNNHITYDKLTAIDLPQLITSIKNNQSISNAFRQIASPYIQVTGGQLGYQDSVFYLVGGQKFTGRYNPMNGPSFTQEYTNQIRRFKIQDNGTTLAISDTNSMTDAAALHRRDYNMLPQIFNNGTKGFTVFSGVFQVPSDLPYLNLVDISPANFSVNNSVTIRYNHYHCAKVALYDSVNNVSENIFFGGISQFWDSAGTLIQDDNVPFVNTIAAVNRSAIGSMTETKIGELPLLLGAGTEFIPNRQVAHYENEIIKSDKIVGDSVMIGHVVGGIESTQPNIFFTNTGTQSDATTRIFEVWLKSKNPNEIKDIKEEIGLISQVQFYPNPTNAMLNLDYYAKSTGRLAITISNQLGEVLYKRNWKVDDIGWQKTSFDLDMVPGTYIIQLTDENKSSYKQLFIVSE